MKMTSPELKYLRLLTKQVRGFLARLDELMIQPTIDRKTVALLVGELDFANDMARHFGLNIDLKTGKEVKREAH